MRGRTRSIPSLIRDVRPSDFRDIASTYSGFFLEAEEDPSFGLILYKKKPSLAKNRKWFDNSLKSLRKGDLVFLVAVRNARVVGWCEVRRVSPGTEMDHRGVLGICVKKEFRGMGLGRRLMEAALNKSKGKFEIVELDVFSVNKRAIKLYKEFGFKELGSRRATVKRQGKYYDILIMDLRP